MRHTLFIFCLIALSVGLMAEDTNAQSNLDGMVTLNVQRIKLSELLNSIEKKGNFYFSYSSDQIRQDSLVNIPTGNKTVRELLDDIFNNNIDYRESPGYIILRPAPNRLTLKPDTSYGKDNNYYISGYVIDDRTRLPVKNASIYEKMLLVSTITNEKGFFSIKVKNEGQITLTISKEFYKDSSISFLNDVTISPHQNRTYYSVDAASDKTDRNWLDRMFISSKQRMQNINLGGFMAYVPFQTSFTPGLSTHGMMSSQIVNHYSINALGGYTAGLDGIELGGLFNINRQDVRYLQAAGLFNVVGGNFKGVQLAGLGNTVLKNARGLQAAGIYNTVKDTVTGVQLAGVFNKSHVLRGLAISPVNITDTLDGYAIGLISLSKNGYHEVLISSNEVTTVSVGFKTGNAKLFSIISVGANFTNDIKFYDFSFGLGHDFILNNRCFLSTILSAQSLVSEHWNNSQQINTLSMILNVKTGSKFSFFAGPTLNIYNDVKDENIPDAGRQYIKDGTGLISLKNGKSWIGWSAGISF